MNIIKSVWEQNQTINSASAYSRERFAAFYAQQRDIAYRKRPQVRTSHFDLSADLRKQTYSYIGRQAPREQGSRVNGLRTYFGPVGVVFAVLDRSRDLQEERNRNIA